MSKLKRTREIIQSITDGWGDDRPVHYIDEAQLNLLMLQDGATSSTKDNDDGTVTITVTLQDKQFICTKQAAPM